MVHPTASPPGGLVAARPRRVVVDNAAAEFKKRRPIYFFCFCFVFCFLSVVRFGVR